MGVQALSAELVRQRCFGVGELSPIVFPLTSLLLSRSCIGNGGVYSDSNRLAMRRPPNPAMERTRGRVAQQTAGAEKNGEGFRAFVRCPTLPNPYEDPR